jgi:hypothetical protein
MSNEANGIAPTNRTYVRHDEPVTTHDDAACGQAPASSTPGGASPGWARVERVWWVLLGGSMIVFSAFPLVNMYLGLPTKDYGLWYQVGVAVRQGLDIYPRPETHRLFPFMYPPSAAAILAWVSMLGPVGSLLLLLLLNSAAWIGCIALSVWLAVGPGRQRHPLVVIVPSLATVVLVHNIYLLGQPNLLLLALLLGSFVCIRLRRPIGGGALLATAAAIKAFPILALGYLIYRRMWAASIATVVILAAWLLIAPLAFRTPAQAVDDLVVWSKGMLFTYDANGIAQRPFRSYSYKNQSIMALAHRLLRDMPADGESVLSKRARLAGPRPGKGQPPVDPSTDLLTFLKPHTFNTGVRPNSSTAGNAEKATVGQSVSLSQPPRWDESLPGAQTALRAAWRVNIADCGFKVVTGITLAAILGLSLFVVVVMPPENRRSPRTDAIEFALVTLLTVMFSPLSFNYAYVWLLYPITLALHLTLSESPASPWHRLKLAWIISVILIPAMAIPMPLSAQAYGNLFVPALLLVFGLGAMLRIAGRGAGSSNTISTPIVLTKTRVRTGLASSE